MYKCTRELEPSLDDGEQLTEQQGAALHRGLAETHIQYLLQQKRLQTTNVFIYYKESETFNSSCKS